MKQNFIKHDFFHITVWGIDHMVVNPDQLTHVNDLLKLNFQDQDQDPFWRYVKSSLTFPSCKRKFIKHDLFYINVWGHGIKRVKDKA